MSKWLPTRDQLRGIKTLRFLGEKIFEPNLWHMNRHSVSFAVLAGSICCFLPIPFQMVPCVILCIWRRCNVPIAVAIVWISNPLTMAPMMYFAYRVGLTMLGQPDLLMEIRPTFESMQDQLNRIWLPLMLGSLTCGITMGAIGFTAVRLYWRWKISRYWRSRRTRMPFPGSEDQP